MFYKSTSTLTIIHDDSVPDISQLTLEELAYEITNGHASGQFIEQSRVGLSKRQTALELAEQGSDPDFLLGPDGWKYDLHEGDEVIWTDPDGGESRTLKIASIEYPGEFIRIVDIHGSEIEVLPGELS